MNIHIEDTNDIFLFQQLNVDTMNENDPNIWIIAIWKDKIATARISVCRSCPLSQIC